MSLKNKYLKAEVYIGAVIAVGIFLILTQAIVTLVFTTYDLIIFTRSRTTARFLAQEKMEIAKSMDYNDLGTVGGIPSGLILATETEVINGQAYTITTRVDNIDDPFDGQGVADSNPVDYKTIHLEVGWGGLGATTFNSVALQTNVSSQIDNTTGGVIDITVSDANGAPVSLADVRVVATSLSPPVDTTLTTDTNGRLIIPGALACSTCYEITVNKSGYSTDRTHGTDEVTNPIKPDLTVAENQVSSANFTIGLLGDLTINSTTDRDSGFSVFPNQQFILRGDKVIGTDSTGALVYKYGEIQNTDGSGSINIPDLEWDAYHIIIPTGAGWDVAGANPLKPVILVPGQSEAVAFSSTVGSDHRLHISFTDTASNPIASVAATLKENAGPFEASNSSGLSGDPDFGQSFFDNLGETTYTLYATISGFLEYVNTDVIVTDYTEEKAILISE